MSRAAAKKPFLSENAVTGLQALLVLAGGMVLLVAVPHAWLRPASVAFTVAAVLAVLGIRAWIGRLQSAAKMISANADTPPESLLVALLTPLERRLLRVPPQTSTAGAVALLRARQSRLVSVGMSIALPGICAFLVALFFFAD